MIIVPSFSFKTNNQLITPNASSLFLNIFTKYIIYLLQLWEKTLDSVYYYNPSNFSINRSISNKQYSSQWNYCNVKKSSEIDYYHIFLDTFILEFSSKYFSTIFNILKTRNVRLFHLITSSKVKNLDKLILAFRQAYNVTNPSMCRRFSSICP